MPALHLFHYRFDAFVYNDRPIMLNRALVRVPVFRSRGDPRMPGSGITGIFEDNGFLPKDARQTEILQHSQGSLEECHYYLILSTDLDYAGTGDLTGNLMETGKMPESCRRTIFSSKS